MTLEITDSTFDSTINNNKLVVIDFWAEWCGPCRMLGPIVESLANDNSDVIIGKLNVDSNSNNMVKYGIRGIPAILFFKDGKVMDKVIGVTSKAVLQGKIDELKK